MLRYILEAVRKPHTEPTIPKVPRMQLKQQLKQIENSFRMAGFRQDEIEFMLGKIIQILTLYPDPEQAAKLMETTLTGLSFRRFSQMDFRIFLHKLHPNNSPTMRTEELRKRISSRGTYFTLLESELSLAHTALRKNESANFVPVSMCSLVIP